MFHLAGLRVENRVQNVAQRNMGFNHQEVAMCRAYVMLVQCGSVCYLGHLIKT